MASLASGSSTQKLTKKILLERYDNLNSVAERFVDEMERVQDEIDVIDKEANEKKARVVETYERNKRPICDKRDNLIKNIPYFWLRSFQNHPEICTLIDKEAGDRLQYLNRLDVQCVQDIPSKFAFKLNFFFNENPYFENEVLTKEVTIKDDDTFCCKNTIIRWKPGKKCRGKTTQLPSISRKRKFEEGSFFDWFESNRKNDTFADPFRYLHQRPLDYFRRQSGDDESDSYFEDDGETDATEDESGDDMDVC